ncbi:hypothetical protein B0I37DRAFT_26200 [Chaetomium sp. MPI-CAGE-AT-0009]|nr:hypothetical protein B0I37DRAFT_26200 [Chaetomium sp. MPI-CAGE-AT-0009]
MPARESRQLPKEWPLSGGEPRLQSWSKEAKVLAVLAEVSDSEAQPERPTPTLNTWSAPTGVVGPVTSAALSLQPHWLLMVTMLKATSFIPHGFSFCLVSALRPWKQGAGTWGWEHKISECVSRHNDASHQGGREATVGVNLFWFAAVSSRRMWRCKIRSRGQRRLRYKLCHHLDCRLRVYRTLLTHCNDTSVSTARLVVRHVNFGSAEPSQASAQAWEEFQVHWMSAPIAVVLLAAAQPNPDFS